MASTNLLNRNADATETVAEAPPRKRRTNAGAGPGADYAVGYGKPPIEHRFRKGNSANPRGRPRKTVESVADFTGEPTIRSMRDVLLAEAFRPVRIREGDTTTEMSAIQAAFRELGLAAARGDRLAIVALARLTREAETIDRREEEQEEAYDLAAALEEARQRAIAEADRQWAERRGAAIAAAADSEPVVEAEAVEAVTRNAPEVEEAIAYQRIWSLALAEAEQLFYEVETPVPHPSQIIIDKAADCVAYTIPLKTGQGATLTNLRASLARLKAEAAHHEEHIPYACDWNDEQRITRNRDNALRVCGVIEEGLVAQR